MRAQKYKERREHRQKSALDHAADALQKHAEELVLSFIKAAEKGDWRAADALMTRVHGKPVERVETVNPETPEDVERLTLEEIRALKERILSEHPHLRIVENGG